MIHTNFLLRHQFNWGQEWASLAGSSSAAQVGRSSQPGVLSAQGWRSLTSALPCLESGSFDRYCLPKKCLVLLNSILWCRDRPPHNFDSLQTATLTLYRVTTIKYVDILRAAMDVTFYDVSPRWNLCLLCGIFVYECSVHFKLTILNWPFSENVLPISRQNFSSANSLYFVIYLILASFFAINVFIAYAHRIIALANQ